MHISKELELTLWIFIPILGLLTGSFLNVCIYRLPKGESIIFPSSRCMRCKTKLGVLDLFPVLSHFFLGGKCRYCGVKISYRYSFIELLTGIAFVVTFYYFKVTPAFIVNTALICSLIVISFIDLDCQIIPDEISIGGTVVGLFTALLVSIYPDYINTGLRVGIIDSFLGFSAGFFLLYSISVITGGGMGGGDVKLSGMLGAFLGVKGVLISLLIACIIGALGGIILIVTKLKSRKDLIPFGPYIAVGAIFVIFLGPDKIISTYLSWFGI